MQPAKRHFLLLQGLMGPFFQLVGAALRREGFSVHKVNFNGGDRLFWRQPGGIDYTGTEEDWPAELRGLIAKHRITDVLLFGDCRTLHRAAIEVCREQLTTVHVFEEGYIRPDWVTLEIGGVNGYSALPRDPAWYLDHEFSEPSEHLPQTVPSSFRRRALEGVAYNAADLLSRWYYRHWTTHRPWPPLVEGMGWLKRLVDRKPARRRSKAVLERLSATKARYMLFPLQLDADAQVRLHSPFASIGDALVRVISSFAMHAPEDLRLVVKEHPLDNGVVDWRHRVADVAAQHGVRHRVDYVEEGDIALMVRDSRGLVTINSTTGTLALNSGRPVITLGDAVYGVPGITYTRSLDEFWSDPGEPDMALFDAFRRVLIERCLVKGGFFSDEALDMLVKGSVKRLKAHCPMEYARWLLPRSPQQAVNNIYRPLGMADLPARKVRLKIC
ncbi:capsule polysaccharide export protein [Asaia krungthepensis NRIC 0535]|uniref:Capsule polysaccharide export protein n=2 Tax=Asaia krungthepensis TaxID=220990 RepID=A0ABQ0Q2V6_9PROT|nr:capsule polysaccharide export protein [Asaia krungthepensis NRIC 0535]